MNVILILLDSLNKQHLEPYGAAAGSSPNFERLARRSIKFENHYVGSLPCMPARRELFSGRKDFLWRPWGHLEAFDHPLPRELAKLGHRTQLITDHYHYWEDGAHGYIESFQGFDIVRGQENDPWRVDPVDMDELPEWAQAIERWRPGWGVQHYRNVRDFKDESDFFAAQVMTKAGDWLRRNHGRGDYYLQVELFDVHEPFLVPEPYRSMWTEADDPSYTCWPPYQDAARMREFFAQATQGEIDFIRGQYKGKVSMADKWLGRLMDTMDDLGVWDDTAVIVTTDHGHDLGERQAFAKSFPHFDTHANIPLFVWHPSLAGARTSQALTSTVDLYATILDLAGATGVEAAHSRSFVPVIRGETDHFRDAVLYGNFGTGACCTDGEHVLMQGYDNEASPLYMYSGRLVRPGRTDEEITAGRYIPDVPYPVWRIPLAGWGKEGSILVSRSDPVGEEENRIESDPDLAKRMRDLLVSLLEEEGCPPEQFDRLGLTRV